MPHRGRVAERRRVLRGGGCAAGGVLLADLAGLGQSQAYAVHKGREPDSGEWVRSTYQLNGSAYKQAYARHKGREPDSGDRRVDTSHRRQTAAVSHKGENLIQVEAADVRVQDSKADCCAGAHAAPCACVGVQMRVPAGTSLKRCGAY